MTPQDLAVILDRHAKWLRGEDGGERADLSSANLSAADLSSADLSSADLSSANLSFANLRSADLRFANLSSANLSFANLRSADLRFANLSAADLSSADLSSANLSAADLSSADLRSANLRSANLSSADSILTICPIGSRGAQLVAVIREGTAWVKTGCFWGTIDGFEDRVMANRGGQTLTDYTAAINLIRVWAATRIEAKP